MGFKVRYGVEPALRAWPRHVDPTLPLCSTLLLLLLLPWRSGSSSSSWLLLQPAHCLGGCQGTAYAMMTLNVGQVSGCFSIGLQHFIPNTPVLYLAECVPQSSASAG